MFKELITKEDIIRTIENNEGFTYKQTNYIRWESKRFGVEHLTQDYDCIRWEHRTIYKIDNRFFMEKYTCGDIKRTYFVEVEPVNITVYKEKKNV